MIACTEEPGVTGKACRKMPAISGKHERHDGTRAYDLWLK
jgi:hypothetical protein